MKKTCASALLAVALSGVAYAQDPAPPAHPAPPAPPAPSTQPTPPPIPAVLPTPAARRLPTPLLVQIVVARTQAGKAISRLPFTIACNAEDGRNSTLRMGVEVPVAVGGGKGIQYRNVGINLDCSAESLGDGRFKLKVAVEQSSIADLGRATLKTRGAADTPPSEDSPEGNPMFRTFTSSFGAILRDGQSALHTAATDPVTSDEVTIEVGLKVLK